ncbi:VanZ family protein, partial [Thermoproteota archaeon]
SSSLPQKIVFSDYVLHLIEYLPFGFLVFRAVKNTNIKLPMRKILFLSFLIVFFYSVSDEFHQFFVPGRFMSFKDLLCDNIGAIIGVRIGARFTS